MLLVQPSLQPPGGSNGVAAWALQALVPAHRVTVMTWWPVDVGPVNRFYGTNLRQSDFDTITVPASWRAIVDRLPVPASLLRLSLLMRRTHRVTAAFDVVFGLFNESDFGRRGIQYVHYPTYLRPRPKVDLRWYHPPQAGLDLYYSLADRIAGFSLDRLKQNVTLVNSDWTGRHVEGFLGVETRTLYPPVIDPGQGLPWSERRNAFLAIGRISPEKEYERVMRILARVRETMPGITLTIIGTSDRNTAGYLRSLRAFAESLGSWIEFRDNLDRDEVRRLMGSHRYGIHGMREEHFGMAPAELARAGAIVWVPNGGGQMEIVANEPALMYGSEDEAVRSITRTLVDPAEQDRLRAVLAARAGDFSTDRFMEQVRDVVDTFHE
ncbi:MAG TPA: glycosyltransferase [Vicinamibacterales bacterium]|nr:glycosyltransferase [Vicinamibacterales bacterium]